MPLRLSKLFLPIFLLLTACQAEPEEPTERPWSAPDEQGPFDVGVTTLRFQDTRGKDLVAEVWYPAELSPEDEIATYQYTIVSGISYQDPKVDLRFGPHPLVAFSHGYISIRYQSYYLMEHLASHGFVVIATDHPTNTLFDVDESNNTLMMLERPDDIRHSVDHIQELAGQPGLFENALSDDSYTVMGHSFGAVTAMWLGGAQVDWETLADYCDQGIGNGQVCGLVHTVETIDDGTHGGPDPRVSGTIPISPGLWYAFGDGGTGLASVVDPFVLAGTLDDILSWPDEAEPSWQAMSNPKHLALFEKAGHYGFTMLCGLIPGFREECAGPEDGWEDLGWIQDRSKTLVMAYLGIQRLGDERYEPWLAASEEEDAGRLTVEGPP